MIEVFLLILGGLVGYFIKYILDKWSKKETRDYEIKLKIYQKLSRALFNFRIERINQHEFIREIHNIMADAYMVAPDKVIRGIIGLQKTPGKFEVKDIADFTMELRKDLIPDTDLKGDEYAFFKLLK